jgi:glycosyltransferase involved in cell wall biosynthesis
MATGLPVLLSENVGAKEVVDEGKTGWVVPAENAEALAERMLWCIEHPNALPAMSDAAIATARDYSWTAYRERVTDVIASILNRHDEPTPS